MKLFSLALFCSVVGCAQVKLQCPTTGQMEASLNNPSVVTLAEGLLTLLSTVGIVGGARAEKATPPPPTQYSGTLTWSTLALLGNQSVQCGQVAPVTTGK